MEAFDGELGIEPILFTAGVIADIGVSQRRQFTGGVLRSVSRRIGAVNDDLRTLIGQELRSHCGHTIRRQVYCSRQMVVMVGRRRQSFDQQKSVFPINLLFQFIS